MLEPSEHRAKKGGKAPKLSFRGGEALEEVIGFSDGTGFAVGVGPKVWLGAAVKPLLSHSAPVEFNSPPKCHNIRGRRKSAGDENRPLGP